MMLQLPDPAVVQKIAEYVILTLVIVALYLASAEDIKYRRISKKTIVYLYLLAPAYLYVSGADFMVASLCFMFTGVVFAGMWFISRGGFGIGDVLVITAIAWMTADFGILKIFLLSMAVMSIPWALFWIWKTHKNGYKGILHGFKKTLPIDELRPGMVLDSDNFMTGLDQKDIEDLKRSGRVYVAVKLPMPYIPVIFFALMVYIVFILYFV